MQAAVQIRFGGSDDDAGGFERDWQGGPLPSDFEDLPYRVEVWDATGSFPESLVAITVTPALAYAAYYAAAREFHGRDVTVKHKGQTLSRWRGRIN